MRSTSSVDSAHIVVAFRQGLNQAGFVEGQDCAIEYRWADNQLDRLPALVADLLRQPVDVIVANTPAAFAAKAVTMTVPIVFAGGGDPVRDGLVASLSRPGGNVTGVHFFFSELGAKRLDLLRQIAPRATTIAVLVNPNHGDTEAERTDVLATGQAIGQQLFVLDVNKRPGYRGGVCDRGPAWRWGAVRRHRRLHELLSGTARCAGGSPRASGEL